MPRFHGLARPAPDNLPQPVRWESQAACAGEDPDLFFPDGDPARIQAAKRICQGCPVFSECLAVALERREAHGVWGGTDERERHAGARRYVTPSGGRRNAPAGRGSGGRTKAR